MSDVISFLRNWWFHILIVPLVLNLYLADAPAWNYLVLFGLLLFLLGIAEHTNRQRGELIDLIVQSVVAERKENNAGQ